VKGKKRIGPSSGHTTQYPPEAGTCATFLESHNFVTLTCKYCSAPVRGRKGSHGSPMHMPQKNIFSILGFYFLKKVIHISMFKTLHSNVVMQ